MQPDPIRQLHQRAEQVGRLTGDLAAATPQRSEGTDVTGWVIVVLGSDGLPAEIRVRDGWHQRVDPDRLDAAVMDAHSDALRQAMRAFTRRLDDTSWWRRQKDADHFPGEDSPAGSNRSAE